MVKAWDGLFCVFFFCSVIIFFCMGHIDVSMSKIQIELRAKVIEKTNVMEKVKVIIS